MRLTTLIIKSRNTSATVAYNVATVTRNFVKLTLISCCVALQTYTSVFNAAELCHTSNQRAWEHLKIIHFCWNKTKIHSSETSSKGFIPTVSFCVLRFLMCDGGRGRLWRALPIASRVLLETRRTDLTPAAGAAHRRWVLRLGTSQPLIPTGEDKRCRSHLVARVAGPCRGEGGFWKCRFAGKGVKVLFFKIKNTNLRDSISQKHPLEWRKQRQTVLTPRRLSSVHVWDLRNVLNKYTRI